VSVLRRSFANPPCGLFAKKLAASNEAAAKTIPLETTAITAYDPSVNSAGRMRRTAIDLAVKFARLDTE
jgi:hypothetical protein